MYESLSQHPPGDVEYLPQRKAGGPEEYLLYGAGQSNLRTVVDGFFSTIGSPRLVPVIRRYDLVHSNRGFFPIGGNKFVVDVEHVSSFVGMDHVRLHQSERLRKIIERRLLSDRCGGIIPHSRAALSTLGLVSQRREVVEKATVVYPAVTLPKREYRHIEKRDPPRLLFMGEYYWKGGREFLSACTRIAETVDFSVTYISLRVHPPASVLKRTMDKFNLTYYEGAIPRRTLLDEVYPGTDLFVMPTYIDTFGYAYLEAMAHSIPCIGTNHFAVPEIVQNNVNGLTIEPAVSYFDSSGLGHPEMHIDEIDHSRVVDSLEEALSQLINSESLRWRMGGEGFRQASEGKFSIAARNSALKGIYERCMHN